jgi:hypothetical protein
MSSRPTSRAGLFSVKYPFIYDDVYLIAEMDKMTGNQWLVMQKIDPRTLRILLEDRVQCIHTALTTIETEDFEERISDEHFEKDMLNIRSSEGIREIRLEPEEKFFAFKSWVAGIAEAGVNAITIQSDIEQFGQLIYPIANRIFNFLLKAKTAFIKDFLILMERDCVFEGEYHKPSIHANLFKLLKVMILEEKEAWNRWRDIVEVNYDWYDEWNLYLVKNFKDLMALIYDLQPSAKVFLEEERYHFILTMPESRKLADWEETTRNSVQYQNKFYFCYQSEETGLTALDLYAMKIPKITNIEGFERIPHLQQLHLENNWLEKIEGLESLLNLRHLYLNYNSITSIENLDHLKDLEVLFISNNRIEQITGLEKLTNLKELYLYSNTIEKIEGLETLTELRVLNLAWNQIKHIAGLENLRNLTRLNLGGNSISSINGLEPLINLEILDFYNNQLKEEPDLSYFPNLREVNMNDNPFQEEKK